MDVWLERQKDNIHKRLETKEKPSAREERRFIPLKGWSRKRDFPFYSEEHPKNIQIAKQLAYAHELDSLASSVEVLAGDENAAPVSDSALDKKDPGGAPEAQAVEWNTKYPRIDLPEIEQQPGQAIREDTPGHIEQAFPKLCPHGTVERKTKYPKTESKKQIQCGPNGPMAKWWYEEFPFLSLDEIPPWMTPDWDKWPNGSIFGEDINWNVEGMEMQ